VTLHDRDGTPTVAHFTFIDRSATSTRRNPRDGARPVLFQRQIYRGDGGGLLPPREDPRDLRARAGIPAEL
jgi:hypothetical protein